MTTRVHKITIRHKTAHDEGEPRKAVATLDVAPSKREEARKNSLGGETTPATASNRLDRNQR